MTLKPLSRQFTPVRTPNPVRSQAASKKIEAEADQVQVTSSEFHISGKDIKFQIPLEGVALVGRLDDSALKLNDTEVSRKHAAFRVKDGTLQLNDLGSTNGTYVNGERIKPNVWRTVESGNKLKMGQTTLTVGEAEPSPLPDLGETGLHGAGQVAGAAVPGPAGYVLRNLLTGESLPLKSDSKVGVGRHPDNQIHLPDTLAGRYHAGLAVQGDQVLLRDENSLNGTRVNGEKVEPQQWNLVDAGSKITIGASPFRLISPLNVDSKSSLEKVVDFRELIVDPAVQREKHGSVVPDKPNAYWQNNAEARRHFEDYLDKGDFSDSEAFESVLKESHKLAVEGSSGENRYYGRGGQIHGPERLPAGEFHNGVQGGRRDEMSKQVESIARRYGDPYRFDPHHSPPSVRLPGIKENDRPGNLQLGDTQKHIYPPPRAFGDYFNQMQKRLEKLEKLPDGAKDEKLDTIAEFYHYGANVRPFRNVNNSLFMNFTNSLLKRHGFKPVYHGKLDHAAHRLQPDTFNRYFKDWASGEGAIS